VIALENVTKTFQNGKGRRSVLNGVSVCLGRGETVALLGRNGAGKSTVLRLLAGILRPDIGRIVARGAISWPVGFAGGLHGDMTGAQNIRFVARIYGRDTSDMVRYCRQMSELGDSLSMPVRSYSSGMRARLAFSMSMAVPFDYYLIDEITSVGDLTFREKSEAILSARLRETGGIVVSHSLGSLRRMCASGLVLEGGKLTHFPDVEDAIRQYQRLLSLA